jgi:hypothetical protein
MEGNLIKWLAIVQSKPFALIVKKSAISIMDISGFMKMVG